jgi:TRAP-type C4-dicarboxylate transport system permease small subunit
MPSPAGGCACRRAGARILSQLHDIHRGEYGRRLVVGHPHGTRKAMSDGHTRILRSGYRLPPVLGAAYTYMLQLCDLIAGLALATEVVLITINVTARFVFNHTFGWMDEFSAYTLLWLIIPGTVVLMDRYGLFYAEVLLLFIKTPAIRKMIFVFNSILLLAFFAIVLPTGVDYVRITWSFVLDYSEIPKFVFYSSLPVWGLMMLIVILKKLICMEDPDVTEIDQES